MDPESIIAVIIGIKGKEFYEVGTKLRKQKALHIRNKFTLYKEEYLSIGGVRKKDISVCEKAFFSWWTGIQKMQQFKEMYYEYTVCLWLSASLL